MDLKNLDKIRSFILQGLGAETIEEMRLKLTELNDFINHSDFDSLVLQSKQELFRILDCLPSMIGYWDKDLKNVISNNAYAEYFGKTPKEIRGHHIKDLLGQKLYDKNLPYIRAVLGGDPQVFERIIPTPSGVDKYTLAHYLPDNINGKILGFFVIVTDISKIKELEKETREYQVKLMASSKLSSLGEMASGIAHEINNPLAIINGRVALIKNRIEKGPVNIEAINEDLNKIEATVVRISKIISGLLSFSRNSENDLIEKVKLSQIIDDTLSFCNERFKNHNVELKLLGQMDVYIECQPSQIAQIILNLLNNAFDAVESLPQKWVKLESSVSGSRIIISVTDSGHGIPDDVLEKIMQPFFTTKKIGKGTGLGLSISRGISEKHHGKLYYDGTYPNTRFILELPLTQNKSV